MPATSLLLILCNNCADASPGFYPVLYSSLGIYIPLIVINCIILGRAEAYASKNKPIPSLFDGIGMGLGFTLSITCIGAVRELIGAGSIFGQADPSTLAERCSGKNGLWPVTIFILAPGCIFLSLRFYLRFRTKFKIGAAKRGIDQAIQLQGGCCFPAEIPCVSREKGGKEDEKNYY